MHEVREVEMRVQCGRALAALMLILAGATASHAAIADNAYGRLPLTFEQNLGQTDPPCLHRQGGFFT